MMGLEEYRKLQRENKRTLMANPKLAREARRLKLKNNGWEEVMKLNMFINQQQ